MLLSTAYSNAFESASTNMLKEVLQDLKFPTPMFSMEIGKTATFRRSHDANAYVSISLNPFGMIIVVIPEQPFNAYFLITSRLFGNINSFIPVQFLNEFSPISVRLFGRLISSRFLHE